MGPKIRRAKYLDEIEFTENYSLMTEEEITNKCVIFLQKFLNISVFF